MKISNHYVGVERVEVEEKDGFQRVDVLDKFWCEGRVVEIPETPVFMGNARVGIGDVILFAKYSPDTQEVELEGRKLKFIKIDDILAVL